MQNYSLNQAYIFIIFIFLGIFIGLIFDFFRIIRKNIKTKDIMTYFQDILFWSIVCILILYFIYQFNNGEIRFYIFMGIVIGNIFYLLTLSKTFIKVNVKFFDVIKKVFIKLLLRPLKNIIDYIGHFCQNILKLIYKILKKFFFNKNKIKKEGFLKKM